MPPECHRTGSVPGAAGGNPRNTPVGTRLVGGLTRSPVFSSTAPARRARFPEFNEIRRIPGLSGYCHRSPAREMFCSVSSHARPAEKVPEAAVAEAGRK
jgi:hypothetical protein